MNNILVQLTPVTDNNFYQWCDDLPFDLLSISPCYHECVEDVLKEGEEIEVKLVDMDSKTGKLKLSRKVLLPRPDKQSGKR